MLFELLINSYENSILRTDRIYIRNRKTSRELDINSIKKEILIFLINETQ